MHININNLIYPYFVIAGRNKKEKIKSFPGIFRFSLDKLLKDIKEIRQLGLNKILLFGIDARKDYLGSQAYAANSIVAKAVKKIKSKFPDLVVMTDVCLCAYTDHGHCGIIVNRSHSEGVKRPKNLKGRFFAPAGLRRRPERSEGMTRVRIDNKKTLKALAQMALVHAQAGADWVAPSAMAKYQVKAIRDKLEENGFKKMKILGYSAKFASNFYGPFRNAANSSPAFGDRSGYQLGFNNTKQALEEIKDDIKEGADMVMVKPALSYLDVIRQAKSKFKFPLTVYNVSGEYAFIKNGAKDGLWDEKKMVFEVMSGFRRAGADLIITYHAKDIARWLKKEV